MTYEPCTDPRCRFVRAHTLGRISPRMNDLIDSCLLMAMDSIRHGDLELTGFKHRDTRATIYLDDNGDAYGFTESGMVRFASPGAAIGALCDDPASRFDA